MEDRKKIEILSEEETGKSYIILNGEKCYFENAIISNDYTDIDAKKDELRQELANAAGIELKSSTYKEYKEEKKNIGLLANGNMIVSHKGKTCFGYEDNLYGIVSPYGDILVDFKYKSIKPLKGKDGKIVHEGCYIVESTNGYVPHKGYMDDRYSNYKGIIFENGEELFPEGFKKIDCVEYDKEKDIITCNCYENWVGLLYGKAGNGFNENLMTEHGNTLENFIIEQKLNELHAKKELDEQSIGKSTINTSTEHKDKALEIIESRMNQRENVQQIK